MMTLRTMAMVLALGLLAACQTMQPSPVGTNCVHMGRTGVLQCS
jgi:hypothetical protein